MKWLKWVVVGVLGIMLLFMFLPTDTADTYDVQNTEAHYTSPARKLVSQYATYSRELIVLKEEEPEVISATGYIYCDKDGNGIDSSVTSGLSGSRAGSSHVGEDIAPVSGWRGYGVEELWAVCPFEGDVKKAGYSASNYGYGYTVLVQVTEHVDVRYAHLAYGAGKAVQYSGYTTAASLISNYPFQAVGYPDEWISEVEWCRRNGSSFGGVSERTVGPSSIKVSEGDHIEAGAIIGVPGDTGNSTGLHAHFELRYVTRERTYYASITEAMSGVALKDLTWHYFLGSTMYATSAIDAGMNLEELNIQIQRSQDAST